MANIKGIKFVATKPSKDVQAAADTLLANLNKKFGKGTAMRVGDKDVVQVEVIPTGVYTLDQEALGVGGIPRGRVIEIYGPESSGKTTLALQIIAQAQKLGHIGALVDAEHAFDPTWAEKLGVDVDNLIINQPDNGEQALEITLEMVESGAVTVIVVDSVAALVPKAELDGEMGDSHVGLQARLMSQALRKLTAKIAQKNVIVIFINQIREKIGVMFGSPETTTGGRALKFYASVRIDVRRTGYVKDGAGDDAVAIAAQTKFKVVKNKVAPPFRTTTCDLMFAGGGFDKEGNVLDKAVALGVVEKAGAWYSFEAERLGQGRNAVRESLANDPVVYKKIYQAMLAAVKAEAESEQKKETETL